MDRGVVHLTYSLIKYPVSSKGIETEGCTSSYCFVHLSLKPDSYFYQCEILQTFFKYTYALCESRQLLSMLTDKAFLSGNVFLLYFSSEHFAITFKDRWDLDCLTSTKQQI